MDMFLPGSREQMARTERVANVAMTIAMTCDAVTQRPTYKKLPLEDLGRRGLGGGHRGQRRRGPYRLATRRRARLWKRLPVVPLWGADACEERAPLSPQPKPMPPREKIPDGVVSATFV